LKEQLKIVVPFVLIVYLLVSLSANFAQSYVIFRSNNIFFSPPKNLDIEEVYIAGAFGNFIRRESAINLGLIPEMEVNKVHLIGNGSLEGSRMALFDKDILDHAKNLAEGTKFIELAGKPEFQELYVDNMYLPQK